MSKPNVRAARRSRRGLTLIELIVGVFISVFLTAAAVAFAAHETRLMGISRDKLDMSQSSRASIDLLASDLAMAGGGVGFDEGNVFRGIDNGTFSIGACNFNTSGAAVGFNPANPPPVGAHEVINLRTVGAQGTRPAAYATRTLDLNINYADGAYSTIANYAGLSGQFCAGPDISFRVNEIMLFRTETGDRFTAVEINSPPAVVPCTYGVCAGGCRNFFFSPTTIMDSGFGSAAANYLGGEAAGGMKQVVWFVASDGTDGTLRRAVFDTNPQTCVARDNNLGGAVAENVETLQAQIYQFITDPTIIAPPQWVNVGQTGIVGQNRFRTRIDVEIVMRTRRSTDRQRPPVRLMLQSNLCAPNVGACNVPQDFGDRDVVRTSVELKNAGLYQN